MRRLPAPIRSIGLLALALLPAGCVDTFPDISPAARGTVDGGVRLDDGVGGQGGDQGVDLDDGVPPDRGVDPDDGVISDRGVPPDRGVDIDQCVIDLQAEAITLRTWNETGDEAEVGFAARCGVSEVAAPAWLETDLQGDSLRLTTTAGRGLLEDTITLTGPDSRASLAVRRIGLGVGDGPRRALIYVVDGLKGESLAASRPPAIDWLSGLGQVAWAGQPHQPADGASRASGWASLLTGQPLTTHGFQGEGRLELPTFADRLPDAVHFAAEWSVAAGLGGTQALERRAVVERSVAAIAGDARLVIAGVDGLLDARPDAIASRRAQLDADLDALLAAISARPPEEDWLIVVTTASPGGEGPPDLPILLAAPRRAQLDIGAPSLPDVHTTVLGWLGALRPGWDLPGAQIGGPGEAICDDELDNDGDGRIDCRDADCAAQCDLACVDADVSARTGVDVLTIPMAGLPDDRVDCAGEAASPEATIAWVAPADAVYTVSTQGSSFDTVLGVTAGDCGSEADLCNDDPYGVQGVAEPAAVTFSTTEGNPVQISVSGWRAPGPEDVAQVSIINATATCAAAPLLDGEVRLDNDGQRQVLEPQRDGLGPRDCERSTAHRLIRWRAEPGQWRIELTANFPATFAVWRWDCTGEPGFLGCRSDTADIDVDNPGDYVISVGSVWDEDAIETGAFSVRVSPR